MGQTNTKAKEQRDINSNTDVCEIVIENQETLIETIGSYNEIEPSERHDEIKESTKTKPNKKPPEKVKSFLSEDDGDTFALNGTFKEQEEVNMSHAVKQQNFLLDDIPEEGATSIPPPEEGPPQQEEQTTDQDKKQQLRKKKRSGRRRKMKIVPFSDPNEEESHVSLYSSRSAIVPNELFDIVIPPPPEFSTPDFAPQEDKDIVTKPQIDGAVFKFLLTQVLEPSEQSMDDSVDDDHITPVQLYNCLTDGQKSPYMFDTTFLLLIDTRSAEEYAEGHIATSHHISEIQENMERFMPATQYTMIVLYDTDGRQYSLTTSDISVAMETLIQQDADAFVLDGGYASFHYLFPFWCTTKVPTNLKERASLVLKLPSIILNHKLYLGNADHASNEQGLKDIGITHVVCISQEGSRFDNIEYHHIKLADEPKSELYLHFADAISFIKTALSQRGKVLVHCNLGQSRSATIILAYLMFSRHWSLEAAYSFVKECRPVIHPNSGFISQLLTFEKALFGRQLTNASNFGYEKEIDIACVKLSQPNPEQLSLSASKLPDDKENETEIVTETQEAVTSYNPVTVVGAQNAINENPEHPENSNEIIRCKGIEVPTEGLESNHFEEEITLGDECVENIQNHTQNRYVTEIVDKSLSVSQETLDNTIVSI